MGRFYTPVQAEFTDNFIYQPPWQFAMAALSTKEGQIQEQLDNVNFLQNIPIDFYKDYDKDYVEKIRTELEESVDEIVKEMRADVLNPASGNKLASLQRDLLKRFETGDLSNVLQSAENYRKFEDQLSKMSPYEQEQIKKNLLNPLVEEAGGFGSAKKVFDPGVLQSHRKLDQEFIQEMIATGFIKPDQVEKASSGPGGNGYIYTVKTGEGGLTEEKLEEAFKNWVNSKEDLKSYNEFSSKVYDQNYFDQEGNLNWSPGSVLDKDLGVIKSGAYRVHTEDRSTTSDQTYMWKKEREEAAAAEEALQSSANGDIDLADDTYTTYEMVNGELKAVNHRLGADRAQAVKNLIGESGVLVALNDYIKNQYGGENFYSTFLSDVANNRVRTKTETGWKNQTFGVNELKSIYKAGGAEISDAQAKTILSQMKSIDASLRPQKSWNAIKSDPKSKEAAKKNLDNAAAQQNYRVRIGTESGSGHVSKKEQSFSEWENDKANRVWLGIPEDASNVKLSYKKDSASPWGLAYKNTNGTVKDFPTAMTITVTYEDKDGTQKSKTLNAYSYDLRITDEGNVLDNTYRTQ